MSQRETMDHGAGSQFEKRIYVENITIDIPPYTLGDSQKNTNDSTLYQRSPGPEKI